MPKTLRKTGFVRIAQRTTRHNARSPPILPGSFSGGALRFNAPFDLTNTRAITLNVVGATVKVTKGLDFLTVLGHSGRVACNS